MIALSSGGVLAERARRDGVPWVELPGGFPPRAAVGHAFFPLFRVATRLGMVTDAEADEVPERLRMLAGEWGPGRATSTNPAKMLAVHLQDRLPVLHAATPITRAVARRFMAQLAENAKTLALVSDYPELTHNEVVAWDGDPAWTRRVSVVEFIDPEEAPGIAAVRSGVATLARQHGGTVMQIAARGTTRLERTWSFVLLVDLASVYLALLQGRDPSTIAPITWLKGLVATDAPGGRS
jgi:glucose/mannose-6-phosphate isomerase